MHVDGVVSGAGIDKRVAGDLLHIDNVVTSPGVERGGTIMGVFDRELVAAGSEVDLHFFQLLEADAAGLRSTADRPITAHSETGDPMTDEAEAVVEEKLTHAKCGVLERCDVVRVVEYQEVRLVVFVHEEIRVGVE